MPGNGHPTRDEIVALETAYWNALRNKDGEAAARLTADPAVVSGKQGIMTVSRDKMKSLTEEGKWTLNSFQFEEISFLAPGPDVAILAYTVTQNVTMDGKTSTMRAADSSTWIRGGGGWQCCAHSETFLDQG